MSTPLDAPVPAPVNPGTRVVVLGRPGCHLCEVAAKIVDRVCREVGVAWEEASIDGDADLTRAYWEQIPVTFVDGRRHDFWRVDESRLRAELTSGAAPQA